MSVQIEQADALGEGAEALSRGSSRRWVLVTCLVLVAGLTASLAGAALWGSSVRTHERQTFDATASDVTATLETLLRRDADFVGTTRAVLRMQPHMSDTRFEEWFGELRGRERIAGGLGASVVERVPASALGAFQVRRDRDPSFRAVVGGKVERVAVTGRSNYCLLSATVSIRGGLGSELAHVLQGDWCAPSSAIGGSQGPLLQAQTDTGQLLVLPVTGQGVHTIVFQTAFYRRGARLGSVAQRRAAVSGWLLSTFNIPAVMLLAVGAHRGLSVALYHSNPGRRIELLNRLGSAGAAGRFSYRRTLKIGGDWAVTVSGAPPAGGFSAGAQGLLILLGGSVVSVLLCSLILVLSRSRERAFAMVREKTGQLRHQALHDDLTGLSNRVLALDRAQQMLARARRRQESVAALYIDLDGFKHVNDTFGHAAGDELLQLVAERLLMVVRDVDTAARLGGDEFVVLLEGSTLDAGPELVAERLLEVLGEPYDLGEELGRRLSVTASVGIAVGRKGTADELLRDADLALYEAKAAGRSRYAMFESSMQTASQDRLTLEMDLAGALAQQQLFLLYQPMFDLQSESVTGVEALIRWHHPTRGVMSPDGFISIAEQSGLIVPIGRWVLDQACRQAAVWHREGHHIGMWVNVSARQLDDNQLIEDVRGALRDSGLDPEALTLEITETTLMRDCEATAERLTSLKELGVRIAIDDFGTGYSSLAYLSRFPADTLKIDRSFVEGIATSRASAALIHTFVQLGKTLGVETLAEGIEDRAQLETLQREQCDLGQGFLFSRPLGADKIESLLDAAGSRVQQLVVG
jgi:diguanylate cyclase (GGDEF)-like protein